MDQPQRRHDPLALAVIGGAVVVLVALVAGLVLSIRSAPLAPAPAGPSLGDRIGDLARQAAKEITDAVREDRPVKVPGASKPSPPAKAPSGVLLPKLPGGRSWQYRVEVEPASWRDATLSYRTVEQLKGMAVFAEFRHAGGKSNFPLGTFQAGHPSHANVRFPGFFHYAAYLDKPLNVGQRFVWGWPWQLPNGAIRAGRVKNFDGRVAAWETMRWQGGTVPVARIEVVLSYYDQGKVQATARETLWVSPTHFQVVKVVREGRTPDEGSQRIVAELIEFR